MLLLGDGSDEGWQGMLAHEGINTYSKQIADPRELCQRGLTFSLALGNADEGKNDHDDKCWKIRRIGWVGERRNMVK